MPDAGDAFAEEYYRTLMRISEQLGRDAGRGGKAVLRGVSQFVKGLTETVQSSKEQTIYAQGRGAVEQNGNAIAYETLYGHSMQDVREIVAFLNENHIEAYGDIDDIPFGNGRYKALSVKSVECNQDGLFCVYVPRRERPIFGASSIEGLSINAAEHYEWLADESIAHSVLAVKLASRLQASKQSIPNAPLIWGHPDNLTFIMKTIPSDTTASVLTDPMDELGILYHTEVFDGFCEFEIAPEHVEYVRDLVSVVCNEVKGITPERFDGIELNADDLLKLGEDVQTLYTATTEVQAVAVKDALTRGNVSYESHYDPESGTELISFRADAEPIVAEVISADLENYDAEIGHKAMSAYGWKEFSENRASTEAADRSGFTHMKITDKAKEEYACFKKADVKSDIKRAKHAAENLQRTKAPKHERNMGTR